MAELKGALKLSLDSNLLILQTKFRLKESGDISKITQLASQSELKQELNFQSKDFFTSLI